MSPVEALILGVVEGLTEFLPVSSTGHLILVSEAFGHSDDAAKTFEVVIQLGAVLAVVIYFRSLLLSLVKGVLAREPERIRLAIAVAIAFFPAAIVGYLLKDVIRAHLMGRWAVAVALIVGGVVMIGAEEWLARRKSPPDEGLPSVTKSRALIIGLAQCAALWPGTSRSMSTILGGQFAGLKTSTAAEFSFLVSIPLLGAATCYDLLKNGKGLVSAYGVPTIGLGLASAFVVSLIVIGAFLKYLKRFGLKPFGYYRIALGVLVLVLAK